MKTTPSIKYHSMTNWIAKENRPKHYRVEMHKRKGSLTNQEKRPRFLKYDKMKKGEEGEKVCF